ncbi:MAG TPA: SGNH/GDSL hydrolase family protein, partial [Arthrobacter sp.]|nr:SGNH/GDSL hydrolase family protein [Arthrobacter sp.]
MASGPRRPAGGAFGSGRDWLKYGGHFVLAVLAVGVAAIALMGPPNPDQAGPAAATRSAATPSAAVPTVTTSVAPSPTGTAAPATGGTPGIELPAEPVLLILGDSSTAGVGADQPDQGWAYLVAAELGYPATVDGAGGTGFAWGG